MKKLPKLLLAILLVLSLSLSICACDVIDNIFGKDCESHVDADKDGKCDECEAPVETQPECTHSDKNDDGKCDECTADFTDGCDNHVDANDDGKCDVAGCNEACTDGCDNHVDLDDNGVCDVAGCNEACIDGCDNHVDANDDGVCDVAGCNKACIDGCDNHVDANDDGVCDVTGCNEAYTDGCDNHVDLDDNGVCDVTGCDEAYTDGCNNHVDANLDHVCDSNGCSVVIGTCADADLDHDCDYGCSKVWGDHADADLDHDCDYGCNVAIGDHADADLDHDCDYGCNVAIGTCEDADKDHDCDYGCSVAFGTCEDADKDHACDYGCDATFGTEEDKDDDRECDYCGEAFEDGCDAQHRDADDDGKCDFGGEDFEDGAEPIVLEEDVEVMGSAKSAGQELIYKLTASTTGAYGIEFWGSYFDINVYCEDASTQAIYTKTGIISSHNDTVNLEEGEVYYFVLTYQENFESYVYLTVSAPEAEASENGESFDTAITLENGAVKEGAWNYNTTYYKFIPTATGNYRIVIGNASYYDINIYSADDLTTAINTWSTEYSGNLEQIVELEEGETYYIVLKSNYGYGYKLTVSYRPECSAHADANDDAKCDVCGDTYTDGCDLKECIDLNNDGLCDNANCDAATENKAAGSTFENAIDLSLDTATTANIVLYGQKIYFKFTATTEWYSINVNPGYYSTLALYDATNTTTTLFTASGSSASQTLDKLFNVTVGNDYYLAIGSSQSEYEYSLTMAEAEDPFVSATDFAFGEEVQNVDFTAKEEKYYVYTATATGEYFIYVESGSYNSTITFYNADKTAIATFQGVYDYNVGAWGGYAINATQALSANETYYIVIASSSSYSATLKISVTAPAAGDTEPEEPECTEHVDEKNNDTDVAEADGKCDVCGEDMPTVEPEEPAAGSSFETAIELEEGVEVTVPDYVDYNQKFFYEFSASGSYDIIFEGYYFGVELYSEDSLTTAISSWTTPNGSLDETVELTEGKVYYIVLTSQYGYGFSLTVSASSDEPVVAAPGASFETAIELEEGVEVSIASSTMGQKFYYKLTASATGSYSVLTDGFNFTFDVYSANDTTTAIKHWVYYSGAATNMVDLEADKTYYIVLTSDYGYYIDMTVSAPSDEPVVAAPGASFETAIELEEGVEVSIASSTIGQKFYYKLTASATGSYSAAINGYYFTVEAFTESDTANAMKTIDVVVDPVTENLELEAGNVYYFVLTSNYGYNIDLTISAPAAE